MAAKLAAGLKWFVVGVIDSFMVMLLLMKAFFGSSLAREHRPSFGKLFKGWQTCRYFGRNLGSVDRGQVPVDGTRADDQVFGHLGIREPLHHQASYLPSAACPARGIG